MILPQFLFLANPLRALGTSQCKFWSDIYQDWHSFCYKYYKYDTLGLYIGLIEREVLNPQRILFTGDGQNTSWVFYGISSYHETYAPICQRFLSGLFQIQFWDFAIANLITRLNGSDIGAGNNLILVKLFKKATTTMRLFSQVQLFEKPSRCCYWTWGSVFSDVFLKLFLAQTRESLLAVVGIMQK